MKGTFGLLWLIAILAATASADPIAIPIGKVADGELTAVMPDKVLMGLLLTHALSIIVGMGKFIWEKFIKETDKTSTQLESLIADVQALKAEVKGLSKLPDETEIIDRLENRVEFLVFKAVNGLGKGKN